MLSAGPQETMTIRSSPIPLCSPLPVIKHSTIHTVKGAESSTIHTVKLAESEMMMTFIGTWKNERVKNLIQSLHHIQERQVADLYINYVRRQQNQRREKAQKQWQDETNRKLLDALDPNSTRPSPGNEYDSVRNNGSSCASEL